MRSSQDSDLDSCQMFLSTEPLELSHWSIHGIYISSWHIFMAHFDSQACMVLISGWLYTNGDSDSTYKVAVANPGNTHFAVCSKKYN